MSKTIYIITQDDGEYGYDLFVDVATTEDEVLEICKKQNNLSYIDYYDKIDFNEDKTQVGFYYKGKYYTTLYFIEKREL